MTRSRNCGMPSELPQALPPVLGDVVGNCREVAAIFGKLAIMKRIAPDLAIDRRAVPAELARHLIDRHLAFDKLVQAIGEGQLQIASGHSKIFKGKPLFFLACRTWK